MRGYCLIVWLGRLCSACRVYRGRPVAYVCKRARTSPAAHSRAHVFSRSLFEIIVPWETFVQVVVQVQWYVVEHGRNDAVTSTMTGP